MHDRLMAPSTNQSILYQQIRILKLRYSGLAYYGQTKPEPILKQSYLIPDLVKNLALPANSCFKYLSRNKTNIIRIIAIKLLQLAYLDPTQHVLISIKRQAYNPNLSLVACMSPQERSEYEDDSFRRLLVQFFHLTKASNQINKVQSYLCRYPIILQAMSLLILSLLKNQHINVEDHNLQISVVVQTVSKVFQLKYWKTKNGVFEFGNGQCLFADFTNVYINSGTVISEQQNSDSDDQQSLRMPIQNINTNQFNQTQKSNKPSSPFVGEYLQSQSRVSSFQNTNQSLVFSPNLEDQRKSFGRVINSSTNFSPYQFTRTVLTSEPNITEQRPLNPSTKPIKKESIKFNYNGNLIKPGTIATTSSGVTIKPMSGGSYTIKYNTNSQNN